MSSVLHVTCCRNTHGLGITIFSSKATLTACASVPESKSSYSARLNLSFCSFRPNCLFHLMPQLFDVDYICHLYTFYARVDLCECCLVQTRTGGVLGAVLSAAV